jgi:hypothetical protein
LGAFLGEAKPTLFFHLKNKTKQLAEARRLPAGTHTRAVECAQLSRTSAGEAVRTGTAVTTSMPS